MADLTCTLSPLVFTELYRLLRLDGVRRDAVEERLDELHYAPDWLEEAAEAYNAKWVDDTQHVTADTVDYCALSVEHSLLATWILAGCRNTGESFDFSSAVRAAIQERILTEAPQLEDTRVTSMSPTICGWTLGKVVGSLDPSLPLVPAHPPNDPHIAAAYIGLVEHVMNLASVEEPWPELAGTALYVRTGGLAQALRPVPPPPPYRGLSHSLNLLMAEAKRHLPASIEEALRRNWIRWVERRNVLTHVEPDEGSDMSFSDSAPYVRTWDQIRWTIVGITQFVCQEISQELQESRPAALRTDPWDYLRREVQTEW